MKILINGKEIIIDQEITVKELLINQKVEMPEYVTVQVNDELISREKFETLLIKENDSIEFLYFMGGGRG